MLYSWYWGKSFNVGEHNNQLKVADLLVTSKMFEQGFVFETIIILNDALFSKRYFLSRCNVLFLQMQHLCMTAPTRVCNLELMGVAPKDMPVYNAAVSILKPKGWNKLKISRAIWALGIEKLRGPLFCSVLDFLFCFKYLLYTSYWNDSTFPRVIWALGFNILRARIKFWGQLDTGPPYSNPCLIPKM